MELIQGSGGADGWQPASGVCRRRGRGCSRARGGGCGPGGTAGGQGGDENLGIGGGEGHLGVVGAEVGRHGVGVGGFIEAGLAAAGIGVTPGLIRIKQ